MSNKPRGQARRASDSPIALPVAAMDEPAIERALAQDRVEILFQPIFGLSSGRAVGAEALARLPEFADGEQLFARARRARLAERLSRHIQRRALALAAGWDGALATLGLSLNLLPEDLARPGYDVWLLAEIERVGIDPARVTVELTEQALIEDVAAVADRLSFLRAAGLKAALDDFGTGYASMATLATLPLDAIKIDRSLIAGIETGERQRIVVRSVLSLARELGLATVVEGVETAGQLALLTEWGCDLYQGFIGARPMPSAQLERFAA
jgi:EAL domain-containing protein (putative c-di-GMP-specific phosphodiesterase class I)